MKQLEINKGTTLRRASVYVADSSGLLALSGYEYQTQLLDSNHDYLSLVTTTADTTETGKLNLSLTAEQTAEVSDSAKYYVVLIKNIDNGWVEVSEPGNVKITEHGAWTS